MTIVLAGTGPTPAGTKLPAPAPLGALHHTMALSSNDWSSAPDFAWLYGITVGWDGPAMKELASKFDWSEEKVTRLRRLRRAFRRLELAEERAGRKS